MRTLKPSKETDERFKGWFLCYPIVSSGPYEDYYENGQLKEKSTFVAGEFDGPFESYYENGQLLWKGTHAASELDGPYESYHESGQLCLRGTYNMGVKCGEWIEGGKTVTYPPC